MSSTPLRPPLKPIFLYLFYWLVVCSLPRIHLVSTTTRCLIPYTDCAKTETQGEGYVVVVIIVCYSPTFDRPYGLVHTNVSDTSPQTDSKKCNTLFLVTSQNSPFTVEKDFWWSDAHYSALSFITPDNPLNVFEYTLYFCRVKSHRCCLYLPSPVYDQYKSSLCTIFDDSLIYTRPLVTFYCDFENRNRSPTTVTGSNLSTPTFPFGFED